MRGFGVYSNSRARLDRLESSTLDVIKDASVLGLSFNMGHLIPRVSPTAGGSPR